MNWIHWVLAPKQAVICHNKEETLTILCNNGANIHLNRSQVEILRKTCGINLVRLPIGHKLTRSHSSMPFNPLIANAFFRAGFIDIMIAMHGLVPDAVAEKMSTVQINGQINDQINVQLSAVERQVLSLVLENPSLTLEDIAICISKSARTVQRQLYGLREKNIIRRVGSRKDGRWEIIQDNDEAGL